MRMTSYDIYYTAVNESVLLVIALFDAPLLHSVPMDGTILKDDIMQFSIRVNTQNTYN